MPETVHPSVAPMIDLCLESDSDVEVVEPQQLRPCTARPKPEIGDQGSQRPEAGSAKPSGDSSNTAVFRNPAAPGLCNSKPKEHSRRSPPTTTSLQPKDALNSLQPACKSSKTPLNSNPQHSPALRVPSTNGRKTAVPTMASKIIAAKQHQPAMVSSQSQERPQGQTFQAQAVQSQSQSHTLLAQPSIQARQLANHGQMISETSRGDLDRFTATHAPQANSSHNSPLDRPQSTAQTAPKMAIQGSASLACPSTNSPLDGPQATAQPALKTAAQKQAMKGATADLRQDGLLHRCQAVAQRLANSESATNSRNNSPRHSSQEVFKTASGAAAMLSAHRVRLQPDAHHATDGDSSRGTGAASADALHTRNADELQKVIDIQTGLPRRQLAASPAAPRAASSAAPSAAPAAAQAASVPQARPKSAASKLRINCRIDGRPVSRSASPAAPADAQPSSAEPGINQQRSPDLPHDTSPQPHDVPKQRSVDRQRLQNSALTNPSTQPQLSTDREGPSEAATGSLHTGTPMQSQQPGQQLLSKAHARKRASAPSNPAVPQGCTALNLTQGMQSGGSPAAFDTSASKCSAVQPPLSELQQAPESHTGNSSSAGHIPPTTSSLKPAKLWQHASQSDAGISPSAGHALPASSNLPVEQRASAVRAVSLAEFVAQCVRLPPQRMGQGQTVSAGTPAASGMARGHVHQEQGFREATTEATREATPSTGIPPQQAAPSVGLDGLAAPAMVGKGMHGEPAPSRKAVPSPSTRLPSTQLEPRRDSNPSGSALPSTAQTGLARQPEHPGHSAEAVDPEQQPSGIPMGSVGPSSGPETPFKQPAMLLPNGSVSTPPVNRAPPPSTPPSSSCAAGSTQSGSKTVRRAKLLRTKHSPNGRLRSPEQIARMGPGAVFKSESSQENSQKVTSGNGPPSTGRLLSQLMRQLSPRKSETITSGAPPAKPRQTSIAERSVPSWPGPRPDVGQSQRSKHIAGPPADAPKPPAGPDPSDRPQLHTGQGAAPAIMQSKTAAMSDAHALSIGGSKVTNVDAAKQAGKTVAQRAVGGLQPAERDSSTGSATTHEAARGLQTGLSRELDQPTSQARDAHENAVHGGPLLQLRHDGSCDSSAHPATGERGQTAARDACQTVTTSPASDDVLPDTPEGATSPAPQPSRTVAFPRNHGVQTPPAPGPAVPHSSNPAGRPLSAVRSAPTANDAAHPLTHHAQAAAKTDAATSAPLRDAHAGAPTKDPLQHVPPADVAASGSAAGAPDGAAEAAAASAASGGAASPTADAIGTREEPAATAGAQLCHSMEAALGFVCTILNRLTFTSCLQH